MPPARPGPRAAALPSPPAGVPGLRAARPAATRRGSQRRGRPGRGATMEEPQRARSHTVTTTASSFAENFSTTSSSFAYDREFLRTLPGLLIVAEIVSASGRAGLGAGAQVGPAPCSSPGSLFTCSGGLRRNPFCSASSSSPGAELRDPLSERGLITLGSFGGDGRDPWEVRWRETRLAGSSLWSWCVLRAGCLVGIEFVLMSVRDTWRLPYLLSTWVAFSLKEKLYEDQRRGEDFFFF